MNKVFSLLRTLGLLIVFANSALAGTSYSRNLRDIFGGIEGSITPIGDIGKLTAIVDLRGFIPLSLVSNDRYYHIASLDTFAWYQYPTRPGVARIYYGNAAPLTVSLVAKTPIVTETRLSGEYLRWAKFAYSLTKTSGSELFQSAGGDKSEFEVAEPVIILMTARSAILVISLRYSDSRKYGTGQILAAYEFSRRLKAYKTFYSLHSTMLFNRSSRVVFEQSLPFIMKATQLFIAP